VLDGYGGVWFYTTNSAFFSIPNPQPQTERSIGSFEGHLSYDFNKLHAWASLDGNFWFGGSTSLYGISNPVTRQTSLPDRVMQQDNCQSQPVISHHFRTNNAKTTHNKSIGTLINCDSPGSRERGNNSRVLLQDVVTPVNKPVKGFELGGGFHGKCLVI
jgi:hypothetical protein